MHPAPRRCKDESSEWDYPHQSLLVEQAPLGRSDSRGDTAARACPQDKWFFHRAGLASRCPTRRETPQTAFTEIRQGGAGRRPRVARQTAVFIPEPVRFQNCAWLVRGRRPNGDADGSIAQVPVVTLPLPVVRNAMCICRHCQRYAAVGAECRSGRTVSRIRLPWRVRTAKPVNTWWASRRIGD